MSQKKVNEMRGGSIAVEAADHDQKSLKCALIILAVIEALVLIPLVLYKLFS